MGKICKSCGHYYSGDFCDKCGYGKPAKVAESVKKYRKSARKKPLRMQTEEDKKLYAKWAKEEKQGQVQKRTDPKAKTHFLIVVVIAALIVLVSASSAAFSSAIRFSSAICAFNSSSCFLTSALSPAFFSSSATWVL